MGQFWRPLFVGNHLLYHSADVPVAYQTERREANQGTDVGWNGKESC